MFAPTGQYILTADDGASLGLDLVEGFRIHVYACAQHQGSQVKAQPRKPAENQAQQTDGREKKITSNRKIGGAEDAICRIFIVQRGKGHFRNLLTRQIESEAETQRKACAARPRADHRLCRAGDMTDGITSWPPFDGNWWGHNRRDTHTPARQPGGLIARKMLC